MRFFVSGNIDAEIGDAFSRARQAVQTRLNKVTARKNYGTAVQMIGVIPTISRRMPYWERRLFQRSKRSADYRLWMPYERFRRSSAAAREKLLAESALAAVADLDRKAKAASLDFDGERLTADIEKLFKLTRSRARTVR